MNMDNNEQKNKKNLIRIFFEGSIYSKLSFIICGLANIIYGQVVKGLLFLLVEVAYILFMVQSGITNLVNLTTLGTSQQGMVFNEATGIYEVSQGDNSMLFLLYGVATLVATIAFICVWRTSIHAGECARELKASERPVPGFIDDIKSLFDKNINLLFLGLPIALLVVFTVTPLIYMILMAFTSYDAEHQPPGNLFGWVGLDNFKALFSASDKLGSTFWPILGWTIIWAIAATFTCYFGGLFLAILINSKGIKAKKLWRTIFVITMAIPAFISLLVVSTMLGERGIINILLQNWGFTTEALPFLTKANWARGSLIVVNMWIGIPVTMLLASGLLMNVPEELYESARIDGANTFVMFRKITFPYIWFITTPYLISNFIGNINNFNIIYFLTGGNPSTLDYYKGAGKTDLLVTWLFKLTQDSKDYNLAATIGIIIFVISASFTWISYSRSKALKNEEGFQ